MPIRKKTKLEWLKAAYKGLGYTQEEFAKELGCSEAHVSLAINEHSNFSVEEIRKISQMMDIPKSKIGELFSIGINDNAQINKSCRLLQFSAASNITSRY